MLDHLCSPNRPNSTPESGPATGGLGGLGTCCRGRSKEPECTRRFQGSGVLFGYWKCTPPGGRRSGRQIDHPPGVLLFELGRAPVSKRGMEPLAVVDLLDEAGQ